MQNPRETDKQTTDRQRPYTHIQTQERQTWQTIDGTERGLTPTYKPKQTDRGHTPTYKPKRDERTDRRQTNRQREAIGPQTNPRNRQMTDRQADRRHTPTYKPKRDRQTDERQTERGPYAHIQTQTNRQRPYAHIQTRQTDRGHTPTYKPKRDRQTNRQTTDGQREALRPHTNPNRQARGHTLTYKPKRDRLADRQTKVSCLVFSRVRLNKRSWCNSPDLEACTPNN